MLQETRPDEKACSSTLLMSHLSKHDSSVSIQESNPGQTLAALERLHNHGLARLKHYLCHLISLEDSGLIQLLASSLLSNLLKPEARVDTMI
jgi:hypothetical protein